MERDAHPFRRRGPSPQCAICNSRRDGGKRWRHPHTSRRIRREVLEGVLRRTPPLAAMERQMARQSERREKTRRKILDAAARVLVEHGYAATSTTRIVAQAGVSRGAMLHHFPHKAQLMQAVLRHVLHAREQAFQEAIERRRADEDPMAAVIDAFWEAVGVEEAFVPWLELTVAARTDPNLREILAAAANDIEEVVTSNFQRFFALEHRSELVAVLSATGICVLQGLAMREIIRPSLDRKENVLAAVRWIANQQLGKYLRPREGRALPIAEAMNQEGLERSPPT